MKNLNFKKNQVVIFVIALMLVTAGYLNFNNEQNVTKNLLPTSSLADSEQMAAIGDATLVSANQATDKSNVDNNSNTNNKQNIQQSSNTNTVEENAQTNDIETSSEKSNSETNTVTAR